MSWSSTGRAKLLTAARSCRAYLIASIRMTGAAMVNSSELEPDRLADRAVPDGCHPWLIGPGKLDALDPRDNLAEQRARLHLGQRSADAAVDPVAPTERVLVVAIEPVVVGCVPEARITVGGGEHQSAASARRDDVVVDRHVARGDAAGHAAGRIPAQRFVER